MAGNDAVGINPPNADEHLTTPASDWLWAAFSLMGVCFLATLCWSVMVSHNVPTLAQRCADHS